MCMGMLVCMLPRKLMGAVDALTHMPGLGSLCSPRCRACKHQPSAQYFPVSQHPSGAPTALRSGVLLAGWAFGDPGIQATQHCSTILQL